MRVWRVQKYAWIFKPPFIPICMYLYSQKKKFKINCSLFFLLNYTLNNTNNGYVLEFPWNDPLFQKTERRQQVTNLRRVELDEMSPSKLQLPKLMHYYCTQQWLLDYYAACVFYKRKDSFISLFLNAAHLLRSFSSAKLHKAVAQKENEKRNFIAGKNYTLLTACACTCFSSWATSIARTSFFKCPILTAI